MKLVIVFWQDATQFQGWFSPTEAIDQELSPVVSVGWLVHHDEKKLILAQTDSEGGENLCGIFWIPAECVVQVEDL